MPFYDLICENDHEQIDIYLRIGERPPCPTCGLETQTLWRTSSNVVGDECDVWIRHGICNEDGSPRRYTSKAEMTKEAKKRGLINLVEHVTDPKSGSDKAKFTTRWV